MSTIFLVLFAICWTATLGVDGRHGNSDTDVLKLLDEVNQRMVNMENEINELKTQNMEQAELNTELKNQLQTKNTEEMILITELREKNEEQQKIQIDLASKIDKLKQQVISMQRNDQSKFTDANAGVVAFLAKIAAFTGSATEPSLIPFDSVELNIGNAYDPITGLFTPPVDGLYNIGFEARCDNSCASEAFICILLQVNGVTESESCSESPTNTGTALTFQLSAGDTVGLYMDPGPACLSLSPWAVHNKFSGHLIYQII